MEYVVRLAQVHESFRIPELKALASLANIDLEILTYSPDSPFCVIRLSSDEAARKLVSRSILTDSIYELWGSGTDYEALHADIHHRTQHRWPEYKTCSFKFKVLGYQHTLSQRAQVKVIESFDYLPFEGPIKMKNPEYDFGVLEHYVIRTKIPTIIYFGRFIADGGRNIYLPYDLKKRQYISTTSMDSELTFITANIAMAAPGKLLYDPFVGTGSLPIACSHFGAMTMGSDIDGRTVRGTKEKNITTNFDQYGLRPCLLDNFTSDLTNTPLRLTRFLDGIVCDPPYGVREGLRTLGKKDGTGLEVVYIDGVAAHLRPNYIHPKKSYSFDAMLEDVLDFAVLTLVDGGRLCMWMPTANEQGNEVDIPKHPSLQLEDVSTQAFNKWSRCLLTYSRLPDSEVVEVKTRTRPEILPGANADTLNSFRKRYFQGFRTPESTNGTRTP
ncbi:tRNA guanosine-2'-O-methyltransferase [Tothia fuscella]|uniref:tRNA (guanine(10)-N(2))-methyltransferase n=1 Tax=Tothia fuscella TaxID=1048955 RepID=A0A9P4NNX2_9PEZI|nr:tRNA guanosine-2'-O-methyltransferase [Tothia fuscella]